jgi:hypothetical protein
MTPAEPGKPLPTPAATPPTPQPAIPAAKPCDSVHIDQEDDMYDSPEDMEGTSLLPRALKILSVICCPYWEANHHAKILQDKHRVITQRALIAATLAVTFAILQLPYLGRLTGWAEIAVPFVEFLAALGALIFVGWGLKLAVQKHWLLERHKAERFRFLKYRSLLGLITKTKNDPELKAWTRSAQLVATSIQHMKEPDLQQWMKEHYPIAKDDNSLRSVVDESDASEILAYYKQKRLDSQVNYFFKKSEITLKDDWFTKMLPPILFMASLFMALLHFGIDLTDLLIGKLTKTDVTWGKGYAIYIITAAALLPVLGAAIRTHRSAHEYSRNTLRFSAVYQELRDASEVFQALPDITARLRKLWESEEAIEEEHREWLRLMDEAEWYG